MALTEKRLEEIAKLAEGYQVQSNPNYFFRGEAIAELLIELRRYKQALADCVNSYDRHLDDCGHADWEGFHASSADVPDFWYINAKV